MVLHKTQMNVTGLLGAYKHYEWVNGLDNTTLTCFISIKKNLSGWLIPANNKGVWKFGMFNPTSADLVLRRYVLQTQWKSGLHDISSSEFMFVESEGKGTNYPCKGVIGFIMGKCCLWSRYFYYHYHLKLWSNNWNVRSSTSAEQSFS